MSQICDLATRAAFESVPGVQMRSWWGEQVMINTLDMEPGSCIPAHSHPHEQLGLITQGSIVLVIGGIEHQLTAGFSYAVPSSVEHSGTAGPAGCRVTDVFCPLREDYRDAQLQADR